MKQVRKIFFGIDLGTTNSCIAYGVYNPQTKSVKPQILRISQQNLIMGMEQRSLLPSAVFFGERGPICGIYAKDRRKTQPSKVVTSVKNYMGSRQTFKVNNKEYTPQYISSLFLKHIKKEVERQLNIACTEAIIGVPASFDQDMRAATIEAAELAGFNVKEPDGTIKDILIDEPRAALYTFIYRIKTGEILAPNIDFSKKQCVFVFDLGGGTLDASIHFMEVKDEHLEITDLAISRYTQLGGDVFDRVVADYFRRRFIEQYNIEWDKLSPLDQYDIEAKFVSEAEKIKIEITTDVTQRTMYDNITHKELDDNEYSINPGYIWDNKLFFEKITKRKYESIISDLLGWEFTIDDVDRFTDIPVEMSNNIIYPILDVLYKAKKKLGNLPKIDLVLLNGGMTRVHIVKERIEKFFGIKPYEGLDPDLSVAIGACIHHYYYSKGIKLNPVLAESVGLELTRGRVKHLVPAGTVLPYVGEWERFKIPKNDVNVLRIPLYVGERTDTKPPNRKIAERTFKFQRRLKKDELVMARILVDRNKTVKFEYYLAREPEKRYICEANVLGERKLEAADTTAIFRKEMNQTRNQTKRYIEFHKTKTENRESINQSKSYTQKLKLHNLPKTLDVKETLDKFLVSCNSREEKLAAMISEKIIKATNYKDFIVPVGGLLKKTQKALTLKRIYILFGKLLAKNGDYAPYKNYVRRMAEVIHQVDRKGAYFINNVIRYAINALGEIGAQEYEDLVLSAAYNPRTASIKQDILITLGKIGSSKEVVDYATYVLGTTKKIGERIAAAWCLAKLGARTREKPLPISYFDKAIDLLIAALPKYRSHLQATAHFALALGSIGDSRNGTYLSNVSLKRITEVLELLIGKKFNDIKYSGHDLIKLQRLDKKVALISLMMVKGEDISPEEVTLIDSLLDDTPAST